MYNFVSNPFITKANHKPNPSPTFCFLCIKQSLIQEKSFGLTHDSLFSFNAF